MRGIILAVACVLALAACKKDEDGRNIREFSYGVDQKTGLCFADGFESIAHVECTPEVLTIATKDFDGISFYFLDPQTNLCFAHSYKADANVPCTDAVKKKIRE